MRTLQERPLWHIVEGGHGARNFRHNLELVGRFLEDSDVEEEEEAAAAAAVSITPVLEATTQTSWVTPLLNNGPVPRIDAMATNRMGWSTPSEDNFVVRGSDYATTKAKVPATESILQPLAFDWLSSSARIDNVLEHPNNRVMLALEDELKLGKSQPFVWVFNLQVCTTLQCIWFVDSLLFVDSQF